MRHASLFSGIGGFDLAAKWMGWENIFHCEINPFALKVLKYHFPNSIPYADITKSTFSIHRGRIDVLSGGFPCQPFSQAGKRKGTADDRHLWPEMLRAIREIQPRYVVGENVRGFVNWSGGLVFDEVQTNLEDEGYEVAPFILSASSVNAPHQRERIWVIACNPNFPAGGPEESLEQNKKGFFRAEPQTVFRSKNDQPIGCGKISLSDRVTSDAHDRDNEKREFEKGELGEANRRRETNGPSNVFIPDWDKWPTKPPICGGDDGIPRELDGITFSKWRGESIKGFGNAIVPQVAFKIFQTIKRAELDNISTSGS